MSSRIKILLAVGIILVATTIWLLFFMPTQLPGGESNLEPMYGNVEELPNDLKVANEQFIEEITDNGRISREEAGTYLVFVGGWGYYFTGEYDMSMKRFNQAWLVNPENYQVFWGFGKLLAKQNKNEEAKIMFDKALELFRKDDQKKFIKPSYDNAITEISRSDLTKLEIEMLQFIIDLYNNSEKLISCDIATLEGTPCEISP